MITSLNKIQNFGVYQNYVNTQHASDFKEKNIIYGWNYSGKTTFSRLFSSVEKHTVHSDYASGKFEFKLDDNSTLTETNLQPQTLKVKVFNSDFIESNLSWNGSDFNPILLLGEDTIEAEQEIQKYQAILERSLAGYNNKSDTAKDIENQIKSLKTSTAKHIKTTLNIVSAYTATHLDNTIKSLSNPVEDDLLEDDSVSSALKKALSSESDRLDKLSNIYIQLHKKHIFEACNAKLAETPKFSSVIEHLKNNPDISSWIETGLKIHDEKDTCEFCGSEIDSQRIQDFHSHFSRDLAIFKAELAELINQAQNAQIQFDRVNPLQLYTEFRGKTESLNDDIVDAIGEFHTQLESLITNLKNKLEEPFTPFEQVLYSDSYETKLNKALDELNELIDKSNKITDNFDIEKNNAVEKLKKHFAADFLIANDISNKKLEIEKLNRHRVKYNDFSDIVKTKIQELQASISMAQKGRETLNEYISSFLGSDAIQIDVVTIANYERFKLTRNGSLAKNLSEGEKSAIAFSFFLTKLKEETDLNQVIVYIDDPISSLDSNHIFQVNALIKEYFFKKVNDKWEILCKQLFISTHNFEFFSLLKELPLKKNRTGYFQVKKISNEESIIIDLPKSMKNYSSEYHYLFGVLYSFHYSSDKEDLETLLSIPNAIRRFVELYTYSRIPSFSSETVDQRAEKLFGSYESKRILKVLHYFSHLNNIERLSNNSDLICDIENAVNDIMLQLQSDAMHYSALLESLPDE